MSIDDGIRLTELFIPYHGHARASELAGKLIKKFGSFNGVISNSNITNSVFNNIDKELVGRLEALRNAREDIFFDLLEDTQIDTATPIIACNFRTLHQHNDIFRIGSYFYSNGGYVGKSEVSCGDATSVHIYPRELAKKAFELEATHLIIVVGIPETAFNLTPALIENISVCRSALKTLGILISRVVVVNKARTVFEFNPQNKFRPTTVKSIGVD